MSTQELLQTINSALAEGEQEFYIEASGQHDIGGPLWHPQGKPLKFVVKNPGQRLGSMCLDNTEIVVEGTASADVGWLNAGGRIVVKGDAGDTAAHCAAGGSIYIGGRAGTRSGSLMKHDPLYAPPEFWVLKNSGSFSFEFMSGGIAVVCGYDCADFESVLGDRSCTGMVGGTLYFRGPATGISRKDVKLQTLDTEDIAYLESKMDDFLQAIDKAELKRELMQWQEWSKVVPLTYEERSKGIDADMVGFRKQDWISGGIFSDVLQDDFTVIGLVNRGEYRQRIPVWENARYAAPCEFNCPASIPTQQRYNLLRAGRIDEAYKLVLEYTPFPGSVCGSVCPNLCMNECTRADIDLAAQIGRLGSHSLAAQLERPAVATGKRVAVIGGGAAGLSAAWQLARQGHAVTVFEGDAKLGGKMEQVIPRGRLPQEVLQRELQRIQDMGVECKVNHPVDAARFAQIRSQYDAVLVATGAHAGRVIPWPGHQRIVKGIDFLKAVNRGETPRVGKQVVVIGCGNSGMDAAVGAYQMGAQSVLCIDVQKPAADEKEIAHVTELGGKLRWPVSTQELTADAIVTTDGERIAADTVIIAIGETPELGYLPQDILLQRGCLQPDQDYRIADGIYTAGDTIKPGRLVDAIGAAREAAFALHAWLSETVHQPTQKQRIDKLRLSTAYFKKCAGCDLPDAPNDHQRCVSCGTCRDCQMCRRSCPEQAIARLETEAGIEYAVDERRCIGCGVCAGICPCGIWTLQQNTRPVVSGCC